MKTKPEFWAVVSIALALIALNEKAVRSRDAKEPYSFVCFDQWQNSTRRPGVVQHTLKDGGVYVLKRADGTTTYYMQQHGEDCYPEEAAQKRAPAKVEFTDPQPKE